MKEKIRQALAAKAVMTPTDLVGTSQLAEEWNCTHRNVNIRLKGWGVQRYGDKVSRADVEARRARLSSPAQAQNAARRWGVKPEAAREDESEPAGRTRAEAELVRAWVKAEREQLELEVEKRKYVKTDDVRAAFFAAGRICSAERENLPAQVAPLLIGKTDLLEIELILRKHLRATDERSATEIERSLSTLLPAENDETDRDGSDDNGGADRS